MENKLKLTTKAKDNSGHSYNVSLILDYGHVVVNIETTPASWFLSSLLDGKRSNEIYIDAGQNWKCINLDEILAEILN